MHATTTCRIVFSGSSEKLETAVDYFDKLQRGEYFFDNEEETLVLTLEEDLELSDKEAIIKFIDKLYKKFKRKIKIHAIGTLNAIESDAQKKFECQYNKNFFRYRESDWDDNIVFDTDLSYEEFEEENGIGIGMDEDEYDEYMHRAHEGISDSDKDMYGEWEYLD